MQQAFKTLMGQMDSQNNQFNATGFSPGSPFPFPMPPPPGPTTSPSGPTTSSSRPTTPPSTVASQSVVDVPATKVETPPATNVKNEIEKKNEQKTYGIKDLTLLTSLWKSTLLIYIYIYMHICIHTHTKTHIYPLLSNFPLVLKPSHR